MADSLHSIRFPGENESYRKARNELLEAEITLRKNVEAVAALRRNLPLGGPLKEDYVFEAGPSNLNDPPSKKIHLSALFQPGKDTLAIYSYMYGPNMTAPCVSCTSILDGLNGTSPHVRQRINFAVVAKSPLERIRSVASERGWNNLRILSSANNTYNIDYHGENAQGEPRPSLNIFVRHYGKIYHFYHTELLFPPREPGQDGRHVDWISPVWNLPDFTPERPGTDL